MDSIVIFLVSLGVALTVLVRRRIGLLSPYGIFLAFQCLYNLIPWIAGDVFSLDREAVLCQLVLAASANVAFAIAVAAFYVPYEFQSATELLSKQGRQHYIFACVPLFVVTGILCHYFGWHVFAAVGSADGAGGVASITAYFKHICVASYLYYLFRTGVVDRYSWILFFGLMAVTAVDGARTNFFPVLVVALMFWQVGHKVATGKVAFVFTSGIVLLMAVRGLLIGAVGLDMVLGPFVMEGCMGAYSSLQSIYAVQHMKSPPYLLGLGSLDSWVSGIHNWIPGEFSPAGGFYYTAETVAHFGYLGPALVTFLFGWVLCVSEKWKLTHPVIYLAFVATAGTLFAKISFANGGKLFIAQLACLGVLVLLARFREVLVLAIRGGVHESDQTKLLGT